MPVEALIYQPKTVGLPPAAYGMLCRLIHHFWFTGKPLPTNDTRLRALCQCHYPVWRKHGAEIREILADVIPAMERRREIKRETNARLSAMSEIGKGARRYNARLARQETDKQKSARAIALPERTQTQTRINVERRTKRQSQNTFVETHF
jgi:uncharacterized protein YdaU (DUF1376 family)